MGATRSQCIAAVLECCNCLCETPSQGKYQIWSLGKEVPRDVHVLDVLGGPKRKWGIVLLASGLSAEDVRRQRAKKLSAFTAEFCKDSVLTCKKELGRTPNRTEYEKWRKENPGTPSYLVILRLWDPGWPKSQKWDLSLSRMGVETTSIQRIRVIPEQRYTATDCREALLLYSEELGDVPSSYAYEQWRIGRELPSAPTISSKLGGFDRSSKVVRDANGQYWRQSLIEAGLDPALMSQLRDAEYTEQVRARCVAGLRAFVEFFGQRLGSPAMYLRWSQVATTHPCLITVLRYLDPEQRLWEQAVKVAGVEAFPRISWYELTVAESREAFSNRSPDDCIAALVRCQRSLEVERPSYLTYRSWRMRNGGQVPTEGEILLTLDPQSWNWQLALCNAGLCGDSEDVERVSLS